MVILITSNYGNLDWQEGSAEMMETVLKQTHCHHLEASIIIPSGKG